MWGAIMNRWSTPFGRWVQGFTVERVVVELRERGHRVSAPAVYSWVRGAHQPKPTIGLEIVRLAGGRLSFPDVYQHQDLVGQGDSTAATATPASPSRVERDPKPIERTPGQLLQRWSTKP